MHRSKQEHEPEESRAEYLSHFSICALRTCFLSEHDIIGADGFALSLHGVCTCCSCEPLLFVDHLVAKRCEVLKYHLRQKFDILEEKAKNSEGIGLQELEECQALKWPLSAEDAAALGGVVKGSSQSPLFSGFWSQAHCIESRITFIGFARLFFCFFCWEDVGWELERLFLENTSQSRVSCL